MRDQADEKIHDEGVLRSRTLALAKSEYEQRWGALTWHHEIILDVNAWRRAWETARDVERAASHHLDNIRRTVTEAIAFVQACRETEPPPIRDEPPFPPPGRGYPMGEVAQVLAACAPTLQRTLDRIDRRRETRAAFNPAAAAEPGAWIRDRLLPTYYEEDGAKLRGASRHELAVLALLGGWWPSKATGRAVTMQGMKVARVFALQGDLMARARLRILA